MLFSKTCCRITDLDIDIDIDIGIDIDVDIDIDMGRYKYRYRCRYRYRWNRDVKILPYPDIVGCTLPLFLAQRECSPPFAFLYTVRDIDTDLSGNITCIDGWII